MPSKKRKYNARFPAGRIKKIMQTDEDVGKVAQAVPVIISRTLELFVESLLTKAMEITNAKNAKTLSPSHMKQCILSENRFDFLKDLVKNIPDINNEDNNEASSSLSTQADQPSYSSQNMVQNIKTKTETVTTVENLSVKPFPANFYTEQSSSNSVITNKASVIQYSPKIKPIEVPLDNTSRYKVTVDTNKPPKFHLEHNGSKTKHMDVPPLVPIIQQPPQQDIYNNFSSLPSDNLCIDEDYDN